MDIIIQWNIQSLKTKFNELKTILKNYSPVCVYLQETLIGNLNIYPPSGYIIVHSTAARDDGHKRGVAILIRKDIKYEPLRLASNQQAVAIKLFLNKTYTICSLYLPHVNTNKQDMSTLIQQLHQPFLLLGMQRAQYGEELKPTIGARYLRNFF